MACSHALIGAAYAAPHRIEKGRLNPALHGGRQFAP
jgi:hypothetical protein